MEEVEALESRLDLEGLVEETLAQIQEVRIGWA
jgi:hypothetical protein